MAMGAKSPQLTFEGSVRLASRVPMLASFFILVVIGVAGQAAWPDVESVVRGTPVATAAHLTEGHRGPVRVVVDGNVARTTQSPPDALLVVSSSQRFVAVDRAVVQQGKTVWGRLRRLTLIERVRLPVQPPSGFGSAGGNAPRFILDTGSPTRSQLQLAVSVVAAAGFVAAVTMLRAIGHARRPLLGPAGRSLGRFGDPAAVRDAFDAAMRVDHPVSGRLHLPEGFVGFRSRRGFLILPRNDVMWVREGVHPEPTFLSALSFPVLLIQSLTSNALFIHDRFGAVTRIPMSSRKERRTVVREMKFAVPQAIFADDAPTRSLWRRQRVQFIATVDERRAFHESFRSNGFVGPEVDVRTAWGLAPDEVDDELFEAAEAKLHDPVPNGGSGRVTLLGLTSAGSAEKTIDDAEPLVTVTYDITGTDTEGSSESTETVDEITVKRALVDARAHAAR